MLSHAEINNVIDTELGIDEDTHPQETNGGGQDVVKREEAWLALAGCGVEKYTKSRIPQQRDLNTLRYALYHPNSVWFNQPESKKNTILDAIEIIIGKPKKPLFPVGLELGHDSKPSATLSERQLRGQDVLISYGMNVFLVDALENLRVQIEKHNSYWRNPARIGPKLIEEDLVKIRQAIKDLLMFTQVTNQAKPRKPVKRSAFDFSKFQCDQKLLDILVKRFPRQPWCCDEFVLNSPRRLNVALEKRYIQFNPPGWQSIIVVDLDYPNAENAWRKVGLPPPTWSSTNPQNGHAHLAWVLKNPVWVGGDNQQPAMYFKAVQEAFTAALNGDEGYVHMLTKNPVSAAWNTSSCSDYAEYDLGELAMTVILKKKQHKHKNLDDSVGRNCKLFNEARIWSYKQVQQYHDQLTFGANVQAYLESLNIQLPVPMSSIEVLHIGRSISRWTWKYRHFFQNPSERARACQKKSAAVRRANSQGKRNQAIVLRESGCTHSEIASKLGVAKKTIQRWLF